MALILWTTQEIVKQIHLSIIFVCHLKVLFLLVLSSRIRQGSPLQLRSNFLLPWDLCLVTKLVILPSRYMSVKFFLPALNVYCAIYLFATVPSCDSISLMIPQASIRKHKKRKTKKKLDEEEALQ